MLKDMQRPAGFNASPMDNRNLGLGIGIAQLGNADDKAYRALHAVSQTLQAYRWPGKRADKQAALWPTQVELYCLK